MRVPPPILALPVLAPWAGAQDREAAARALFVANCASCHGETGDGKGTTQLDRPARSFMDGGFSFGNTPEALFRTISTGIPGTPMPGFDGSLLEEERRRLADYVVTLGPPLEEVELADTVLVVTDRPLVVRGLLPALGEGLAEHPRGLLAGYPSGITFEYRVDDVRLLALRQGAFVERTDWRGRGGTALNPLGRVVLLLEGGRPEALFRRRQDQPLAARLSSTQAGRESVTLEYHLVDADGEAAHVRETPRVLSTPFGTGFSRHLALEECRAGLEVFGPRFGADALVLDPWVAAVSFAEDRPPLLLCLRSADGSRPHLLGSEEPRVRWVLQPGADRRCALEIVTLSLPRWDDGVRSEVERFARAAAR
jgi:hypothetical protein